MIENDFNRAVRVASEYEGISQQDIATEIGRTVQWVNRAFNGRITPNYREIEKIANLFNLSVIDFFLLGREYVKCTVENCNKIKKNHHHPE